MEKDESIRWLNALNNATLICSKFDFVLPSDAKQSIEELANWFFILMPSWERLQKEENPLISNIYKCNSLWELETYKEKVIWFEWSEKASVFKAYNDKKILLSK